MNSPDTFGQSMKRRRQELDLTRDELALRVSCSPVTIKKIESNERRPSKQMGEALARALQIAAADLDRFLALARGVSPELLLPASAPLPGIFSPGRAGGPPATPRAGIHPFLAGRPGVAR